MKEYDNGMTSWEYPDIKRKYSENGNISGVIDSIKDTVKKICDRRSENLEQVKTSKDAIDKQIPDLLAYLITIKEKIGDYVDDSKQAQQIVMECNKIAGDLIKYQNAVNMLCLRFENKKIRITSIGESSQGKSLFTHLYTGLPNEVLKVKTAIDVKDCTGTVNVLHHVEGANLQIVLEFHTKETILNIVNSYIKKIRQEDNYNDWSINGIDNFTSMDQIKDLCNGRAQNSLQRLIGIDGGLIEGIKAYFEDSSYINELDKDSQSVEKEQLSEYNDMQYHHSKYLAVKRIDITTDMGHNGLFENFEIADTKGASITAGTHANDEIFSAISSSDAVFSLCFVHQAQKYGFYNKVLLNEYAMDLVFKDKHSVILNLSKDFQYSAADDACKILMNTNLVNRIYIGKLVNDNPEHNDEPKDFVNYVVLDMLKNIADKVASFDNNSIQKCNEYCKAINENLDNLTFLLNDVRYTLFNEEILIRQKLTKFCADVHTQIGEKYPDADNYFTRSNYESEVRAGNILTLYETIIGECFSDRVIEKRQEMARKTQHAELVEAINTIFGRISAKAESESWGRANSVGRYIDSVSLELIDVLITKFNKELVRQDEIDVKKQRDDMFQTVWEAFKLNHIFKIPVWDEKVLEASGSPFLKDLQKEYTTSVIEDQMAKKVFFAPYDILIAYCCSERDSDKKWRGIESKKFIIDKTRLVEKLAQEIDGNDLREMLIVGIADKNTAISNIKRGLFDLLNDENRVVENAKIFYSIYTESIASPDEIAKIRKSKNWVSVEQARQGICAISSKKINMLSLITSIEI